MQDTKQEVTRRKKKEREKKRGTESEKNTFENMLLNHFVYAVRSEKGLK